MLKKSLIYISTLLLICSSAPVNANGVFEAGYYKNIDSIRVSGVFDAKYAGAPVAIFLVNKDVDLNNVTDHDIAYAVIDVVGDDGKFKYQFEFNFGLNSAGDYRIMANVIGEISENKILTELESLTCDEIFFDREALNVTVNGSYKFNKNDGNLSFKVIDKISSSVMYEANTVANDGTETFSFILDLKKSGINPGNYTFKIHNAEQSETVFADFLYSDIDTVLRNISAHILSATETKEEKTAALKAILTDAAYQETLGMESWTTYRGLTLNTISDDVYEGIAQSKSEITAIKDLKSEINKSLMTFLLNGAADIDEVYKLLSEECEDVFSIDKLSVYSIYKDDLNVAEKDEILHGMLDLNFDIFTDIEKTFAEKCLIKAINKAEFWSRLQSIIHENTKYITLSGTMNSTALSSVLNGKPFSGISTFLAACETALANTPAPPTVSPGGALGGGTTNRTITVPNAAGEIEYGIKSNRFIDLAGVEWAVDAINFLYEKSIINGKTFNEFYPNDFITREELIKMLVTGVGVSDHTANASFADVETDAWYYTYVAVGAKLGIVNGKGDGTFGIGELVTREDAAVFTYRTLKLLANVESNSDGQTIFSDNSFIADYSKKAVATMNNLGIINGIGDGTFSPKAHCTRAQAAKIVFEALKAAEKY